MLIGLYIERLTVRIEKKMSKTIKAIETEYNGYKFRSRLEARWAVFFDALGIKYEYEPEGFKLPSGQEYLPDFKVKCYGMYGEIDNNSYPCDNCKHLINGEGDLADLNFKCRFFDNLENYRNQTPSPDWFKLRRPPEQTTIIECKKHEPRPCEKTFDLYIEVKGYMTEKDASKIREFSQEFPTLVVGNIPPHGCAFDSNSVHANEGMNGTDIYPFNYNTIDRNCYAAFPAARYGKFYLQEVNCWEWEQEDDREKVEEAYDKARQARFEHGETPKV